MIALTLAEIAAAVGGDLRVAGEDTAETAVDGIVDTDSRTMGPGSIFVAKPGAETDGHRFVGSAVAAGAALAIVEHPVDVAVSQIVVPDAVAALGALARRSSRVSVPTARSGSSASPDRTARPPPRTSSHASSRVKARPSLP